MNYTNIAQMAKSGIAFFSDHNGVFKLITSGGGVEIVGGVEVEKPEQSTTIKGLIRAPKIREVDGERYVVVEARPIRPTGITVAYRPILRRVAVHG